MLKCDWNKNHKTFVLCLTKIRWWIRRGKKWQIEVSGLWKTFSHIPKNHADVWEGRDRFLTERTPVLSARANCEGASRQPPWPSKQRPSGPNSVTWRPDTRVFYVKVYVLTPLVWFRPKDDPPWSAIWERIKQNQIFKNGGPRFFLWGHPWIFVWKPYPNAPEGVSNMNTARSIAAAKAIRALQVSYSNPGLHSARAFGVQAPYTPTHTVRGTACAVTQRNGRWHIFFN